MRSQLPIRWTLLLLTAAGCRDTGPSHSKPVEVPMVLGPGNLDLTDPRAGLADLSGYEAVLVVAFDGSRAGRPVKWTTTYRLQVAKSPAARRLTVETAGDPAELAQPALAERGGVGYQWSGSEPCSALPADVVRLRLDRFDPAALLPGVLGAEEAGADTASGLRATRYTFDQRALGQQGRTESAGQLWLATEGRQLLRYRLTTNADTTYFRDSTQGTMRWDYRLTSGNQAPVIQLPASCPPGPPEVPLLANATQVERDPGVLQYATSVPVGEAIAFYEKELGALGWAPPRASNPMAGMGNDPAVRAALADPQVRAMMKKMGLESIAKKLDGDSAGQSANAASDEETHRIFQKRGKVMRLLVTRADSTTRVLLLSR
ncbi:MAG: hypothetical protein ACKVZ0_10715 [Gemmatimonadales bacterium]